METGYFLTNVMYTLLLYIFHVIFLTFVFYFMLCVCICTQFFDNVINKSFNKTLTMSIFTPNIKCIVLCIAESRIIYFMMF